jgi:hypothetical protein
MAPLSWDNCVVLLALDTAPINASIRLLEAVDCRDGRRIPPLPTTLASRVHPRRLCRAAREAAERHRPLEPAPATGCHAAAQPPTKKTRADPVSGWRSTVCRSIVRPVPQPGQKTVSLQLCGAGPRSRSAATPVA